MPTSAGSMARIAHGMSTDLIGRAADVILKERRTLVLCLRESPYNLIHVRNMEQLILAGAKVMPVVVCTTSATVLAPMVSKIKPSMVSKDPRIVVAPINPTLVAVE